MDIVMIIIVSVMLFLFWCFQGVIWFSGHKPKESSALVGLGYIFLGGPIVWLVGGLVVLLGYKVERIE